MATRQDELRREIGQTRNELGRNVDSLTDRVSPTRVVGRRLDSARSSANKLRSTVMGAPSDVAGELREVSDSSAATVRNATTGNPLAAGLLAFGGAWLVSSLLPSTAKEREAASRTQDFAEEHSEPIKAELQRAVSEGSGALKEQAQEAVDTLKHSAAEAAETVRSH